MLASRHLGRQHHYGLPASPASGYLPTSLMEWTSVPFRNFESWKVHCILWSILLLEYFRTFKKRFTCFGVPIVSNNIYASLSYLNFTCWPRNQFTNRFFLFIERLGKILPRLPTTVILHQSLSERVFQSYFWQVANNTCEYFRRHIYYLALSGRISRI
jgi:hypothetical protein